MSFTLEYLKKVLTPEQFAKASAEYARLITQKPEVDLPAGYGPPVTPNDQMEVALYSADLGGFKREHYFAKPRLWRFDFAWVEHLVAVEVEGGIYRRSNSAACPWCGDHKKGGHLTPAGFLGDIEKYNTATELGWRLFRVTPAMIRDGRAVELVRRVLALEGE